MRKIVIGKRTAERLHRAAYDFESLASRLREAGRASIAEDVRKASSILGQAARHLDEELGI